MQNRTKLFTLALAAMVCTSVIFSGCGSENGAFSESTPETADAAGETTVESTAEELPEAEPTEDARKADASREESAEPDEQLEFDPVSAYSETLEDIALQLADPDLYAADNWIFENVHYNAPAADNTGYLYLDINSDGKEELVICGANDTDRNIYSVYTWNDGKPCRILEGWSRNRYSITDDGKILNFGSAGAANSCFVVFVINKNRDALECEDFYFTDHIGGSAEDVGTYHNTTGEWNVSAAELVSENIDLFSEVHEKYTPVTLTPTPFTELVNAWAEKTAQVSVSRAENIGELGEYTEFNTEIAEYGERIMISSNKNADVILVSLEIEDDYAAFNAKELFEAEITPDKPVIATVEIPDAIPAYGIEVADGTGTRFYAIEMSGEDGSLLLNRITVDSLEHTRG